MIFFVRRRVRPLAGFLAAIGLVLLCLALAGDAHPARALAAARVGLRPLAADRQAATVAQAPVRADLHQPFDVLRALAPQGGSPGPGPAARGPAGGAARPAGPRSPPPVRPLRPAPPGGRPRPRAA